MKRFKTMNNTFLSYSIDTEIAETVLNRCKPWYQANKSGKMTYFAVCPKCENPIQLINVVGASTANPRQYGKHENERVDGFDFFDGHALRTCPLMVRNQNPKRDDRRPMSETSNRIIQLATENFDRIVKLLRRELGVNFSDNYALTMLEDWMRAEAYNYTGANLENIPWMIAYFASTINIYGRYLMAGDELAEAITVRMPEIFVNNDRKVERRNAGPFLNLGLSTLNHQIVRTADEDVTEHLTISVLNLPQNNSPIGAPIIYQRRFNIMHSEFEDVLNSTTPRNGGLLDKARGIAARFGHSV